MTFVPWRLTRLTIAKGKVLLASLLVLSGAPVLGATEARRPNFVILLADDLGYGDLGTFGHPTIATPNLDRMAAEGLKLTSFYAAPLCTPSRAALLTGRYPNRSGLLSRALSGRHHRHPAGGGDAGGGARRRRLSNHGGRQVASRASQSRSCPPRTGSPATSGCSTATTCDRHAPTSRCGSTATTSRSPVTSIKERSPSATPRRRCGSFANRPTGPFFLYLAYTMPHRPLYASERFAGKSRRGLYGDAVETIDWSVGEILRALRESGHDDDTLVLFTSDNGPAISRGLEAGSAGLLRGGKGSSYEGGMREPCIVRWPSRVKPAQVRADVASTLDLFPTFLELARIAPPAQRILDGRSLVPLLDGKPLPSDRALYYWKAGFLEAAREGKWKLRETAPEGSGRTHAATIQSFLERTLTEKRSFTTAEVFGCRCGRRALRSRRRPFRAMERRRRASRRSSIGCADRWRDSLAKSRPVPPSTSPRTIPNHRAPADRP